MNSSRLTIDELKQCAECENLTNEKVDNIITTYHTFSIIVYNAYIKIKYKKDE